MSLHTGVRVRSFDGSGRKQVMSDRSKYKRAEKGDVAYNMMRMWQGAVGVAPEDGLISPAYVVASPLEGVKSRYFTELFRTDSYMGEVDAHSHGIVKDRNRLYWADFKEIFSVYPPPDEQELIARFILHIDGLIRGYVGAKRRLINSLEAQKLAIVEDAVTRGLDRGVGLKPSGAEWLNKIPEHWSATRLKFIASDIVDCLHATPVYSDDGSYPAIRTADVTPGALLLSTARLVDESHYQRWTQRMVPREGDILYTREGERFGIAAPVPAGVELCISQRMMAFRIRDTYNSAYIMWQINCRHVYAQAASDLIGAAAPHVNVERIKNFWLLTPPRHEQDGIVEELERATAEIRIAIGHARDEIRLVREYRRRLVSDVVTGQLDVREAAAQLPHEADEADELSLALCR